MTTTTLRAWKGADLPAAAAATGKGGKKKGAAEGKADSAAKKKAAADRKAEREAKKKASAEKAKKKKASADKAKKGKRSGKPSFSIEWSRSQVLCRTGMRGAGQSLALPFEEYGGSDKAIAAAKRWVAKQTKKGCA